MGSIRDFMEKHYLHFNAREVVDAAEAFRRHGDAGGKMLVAMAGAMVWMIVALSTSFLFQALAIGIGAASGLAVGHFGRAVDRRYSRISAYCCILACVCGELLVAYALQLEIWLLYSANSLTLLAVFLLAGVVTARLCTFVWLSRDQKRALWNERHKRDDEPSGSSSQPDGTE